MAWNETLLIMTRVLINDFDGETWSDDRVLQAIITASFMVNSDFGFDTIYVADIEGLSLNPDPTLPETYDPNFIALVTLRAACILNLNTFQAGAANSIKITDGDTSIDTGSSLRGFTDLLKLGPCRGYEMLLDRLTWSQGVGKFGACVLGPYSSSDYDGNYGYESCASFWGGFLGAL